ncbi:Nucleotidyl transferase AbiEii toxin, Type IV TA system [Thermanaeromonas toyohensis ToBE]|uniref:Nucleotidyl transferase AbiEii toxin, Type IV TA system n=1 Tax=Thermanaeromonas toyohensis ToBE TaxID=698762 RepID=A0A1W1VTQ0_9FIRM|nr:nucleotidyl transferase AbiEii/AbiGii toxin family protein [Thermanaeromonas toyohensis]SMB96752.1 Nucleotidyl transferase AbiEii toxin, Type IV TA system [Thermanaeromonas toyohensis ToBE]
MEDKNASRGKAYSRLPGKEDIKKLCEALNEAGVKYILVGGIAINFHGLPRMTHDIDLLIDSSPENVRKIKEALAYLPDGAVRELRDEDVQNYTVVRVADEIVVDLMAKIGDVTVANAGTEAHEIDGVKIVVADLDTMIRTKPGLREKDVKYLLAKKKAISERNRLKM